LAALYKIAAKRPLLQTILGQGGRVDGVSPHAGDLRKGRVSLPNQIYLLTTVTKDRVPVFGDLFYGRIAVRAMRFHAARGFVESLAHVVMPDHVHWLVALQPNERLDRLMRSFKAYTSWRINERRRTPGHAVWQAGYHDHAVRCEEDVVALARYIVVNPIRAGLVSHIGDYPLWDAIWL
jgi:REP element-mobilizing transposase RayT